MVQLEPSSQLVEMRANVSLFRRADEVNEYRARSVMRAILEKSLSSVKTLTPCSKTVAATSVSVVAYGLPSGQAAMPFPNSKQKSSWLEQGVVQRPMGWAARVPGLTQVEAPARRASRAANRA